MNTSEMASGYRYLPSQTPEWHLVIDGMATPCYTGSQEIVESINIDQMQEIQSDERAQYILNMRQLVITARRQILTLQKEKQKLEEKLSSFQPCVQCPSCYGIFRATEDLHFKPDYMKIGKKRKTVELEFESVETLEKWVIASNFEKDRRGNQTMVDVSDAKKMADTMESVESKLPEAVRSQKIRIPLSVQPSTSGSHRTEISDNFLKPGLPKKTKEKKPAASSSLVKARTPVLKNKDIPISSPGASIPIDRALNQPEQRVTTSQQTITPKLPHDVPPKAHSTPKNSISPHHGRQLSMSPNPRHPNTRLTAISPLYSGATKEQEQIATTVSREVLAVKKDPSNLAQTKSHRSAKIQTNTGAKPRSDSKLPESDVAKENGVEHSAPIVSLPRQNGLQQKIKSRSKSNGPLQCSEQIAGNNAINSVTVTGGGIGSSNATIAKAHDGISNPIHSNIKEQSEPVINKPKITTDHPDTSITDSGSTPKTRGKRLELITSESIEMTSKNLQGTPSSIITQTSLAKTPAILGKSILKPRKELENNKSSKSAADLLDKICPNLKSSEKKSKANATPSAVRKFSSQAVESDEIVRIPPIHNERDPLGIANITTPKDNQANEQTKDDRLTRRRSRSQYRKKSPPKRIEVSKPKHENENKGRRLSISPSRTERNPGRSRSSHPRYSERNERERHKSTHRNASPSNVRRHHSRSPNRNHHTRRDSVHRSRRSNSRDRHYSRNSRDRVVRERDESHRSRNRDTKHNRSDRDRAERNERYFLQPAKRHASDQIPQPSSKRNRSDREKNRIPSEKVASGENHHSHSNRDTTFDRNRAQTNTVAFGTDEDIRLSEDMEDGEVLSNDEMEIEVDQYESINQQLDGKDPEIPVNEPFMMENRKDAEVSSPSIITSVIDESSSGEANEDEDESIDVDSVEKVSEQIIRDMQEPNASLIIKEPDVANTAEWENVHEENEKDKELSDDDELNDEEQEDIDEEEENEQEAMEENGVSSNEEEDDDEFCVVADDEDVLSDSFSDSGDGQEDPL